MGFILLLVFILVIAIPIGASYLIYRSMKRSNTNKYFRLIITLFPIVVFVWIIYCAIYPSVDFYENDYAEITEMKFPQNAEIVYMTASYPDQFGDYTSSFLVEMDKLEIEKLRDNLIRKGFVQEKNKFYTDELDYIEKKKRIKKYLEEYTKEIEGGKQYSVGFLEDHKSIVFTRNSW